MLELNQKMIHNMTTIEIIKLLKERKKDFLKTETFSQQPGIYAFFYIGEDFPLFGDKVKKNQLIYIGKTESSQEKRNSNTHFASGKTGSSTVRKSFGSLLCKQESLIPIPRNNSDYAKGRYSHFKFDADSEEIITTWMQNNLALSFYEYPESKDMIEALETDIIKKLVPVLNIDGKNPNNPYKEFLLQLRKNCAKMARENAGYLDSDIQETKKVISASRKKLVNNNTADYIYVDNITNGDVKSNQLRIRAEQKPIFPSEQRGNPVTYDLRFKVKNHEFIAKYRIGSKDGKARSGVLRLGSYVYIELLSINSYSRIRIRLTEQGFYILEKL